MKNQGNEEKKREEQSYFSASSSEVCSLPSKIKSSKCSFRSTKNDDSQPFWFFGNKANSFNRKYGVTRPQSGGKVSLENRNTKELHSNTSSASGSRCTTPRYKRSISPEKKIIIEDKINDNEIIENKLTNKKSQEENNLKSNKIDEVKYSNSIEQKNLTLSSNTTIDKLNCNLSKMPIKISNLSTIRPSSSGSRCRNSESHLPVFIKNHLSRNRLNSDSLLVEKEDFNHDEKFQERPKYSKISRLQRPKTASPILCGDTTSGNLNDELKKKGIKRMETSNLQIMKKNSSRDFHHLDKLETQV